MVQKIYLDYAAATPVHPEVFAAMQPFFSDNFYNPSATYTAGMTVKQSLESARISVAQSLGARNTDVVFTAGGTESTNLAINGVMQLYPDAEVLVSAIEHDAVLAPASAYAMRTIPVDAAGIVDVASIEKLISDTTVLISVMYANNEVGTIQPIRKISALAKRVTSERKQRGIQLPLYVHTDACQAGLYLDVHVSRLGVDLLTLNSGKMYGPKQSGILYAASRVHLQPQIVGGGQEWGTRSGTESVAQATGFAVALHIAQTGRHERIRAMTELQSEFVTQLHTAISGVVINGSRKHRLPNNVHITISGQDNERLLFALDERGIMAAAGSACSASNDEPSHVLKAMGLSDDDARASLRFTMGRSTTLDDITTVVETLKTLV